METRARIPAGVRIRCDVTRLVRTVLDSHPSTIGEERDTDRRLSFSRTVNAPLSRKERTSFFSREVNEGARCYMHAVQVYTRTFASIARRNGIASCEMFVTRKRRARKRVLRINKCLRFPIGWSAASSSITSPTRAVVLCPASFPPPPPPRRRRADRSPFYIRTCRNRSRPRGCEVPYKSPTSRRRRGR